jgi:hypothetical protein
VAPVSLFRSRSDHGSDATEDRDMVFDHWEPDSPYLTDGTTLYRYVGGVPSGTGELVALEDCTSLKILLFDLDELRALALRPVGATASEPRSPEPRH